MDEKSKKRKKGSIREEDVSTLLLRYSVKTVLTLLQEVAKVAGEKIDWNEIVKNTSIGISSARECQMLWRHLAYGQTLTDQFGNAADPMDDDSDLEYEMEAFPAISRETSVEAAACVKVCVASDYPIDSHVPNNLTIEAPLTINIPKLKVPSASSFPANGMLGTNIFIPVSVEKEPPSSGTCGEKRPKDGKSGADFAPRRKRRVWSIEDDVKLTAAVQKHGEQNWECIARGDFKNDRKASELSHRWANIRRKKGNLNAGTSSKLSEARLAATRAISLALGNNMKPAHQMSNVPQVDLLETSNVQQSTNLNFSENESVVKTVGIKSQHKSQNASAAPSDPQLGILGPPKSQVSTERPSMNCATSPNSMVKAAAVAAGARIATSADAASVIEAAARSQNVVHIRTGGSSLMKSTTTSMPNQLFSNANFSRNGPAKALVSPYSSTLPSLQLGEDQEAKGKSIKPAELGVQLNPVGSAPVLDASSGMGNATASTSNIEVAETAEAAAVSTSASEMKELSQRDLGADLDTISGHAAVELISDVQSAPSGNLLKQKIDEHQTSLSGNALGGNTQGDQAPISFSDPINQAQDDQVAFPCPEVEDTGSKCADGITTSKEIHENTSSNGRHEDLLCTSLDGSGEASNTTATAGDEENK